MPLKPRTRLKRRPDRSLSGRAPVRHLQSHPIRALINSLTWPETSALLGIEGVDFGGDVLVADVDFVDLFELLDGLVFLARLFQHTTELVEQIFPFFVEG